MKRAAILILLSLILLGCTKPEEKAKQLGFESVEQMNTFNQKGFKTMNDYLASILPGSGCANVEELKHAINEIGKDCNALKEFRQREAAEIAQASKFKQGEKYTWYSDSSCTSSADNVCIGLDDYEYLCKKADGATQWATKLAVPSWWDGVASYLADNGGIDTIKVSWDTTRSKYKCRLSITVQGMYKGSQVLKTVDSGVSGFIVNKEGEILVQSASPMD